MNLVSDLREPNHPAIVFSIVAWPRSTCQVWK